MTNQMFATILFLGSLMVIFGIMAFWFMIKNFLKGIVIERLLGINKGFCQTANEAIQETYACKKREYNTLRINFNDACSGFIEIISKALENNKKVKVAYTYKILECFGNIAVLIGIWMFAMSVLDRISEM